MNYVRRKFEFCFHTRQTDKTLFIYISRLHLEKETVSLLTVQLERILSHGRSNNVNIFYEERENYKIVLWES